jgi:hypothetical protein
MEGIISLWARTVESALYMAGGALTGSAQAVSLLREKRRQEQEDKARSGSDRAAR